MAVGLVQQILEMKQMVAVVTVVMAAKTSSAALEDVKQMLMVSLYEMKMSSVVAAW